jgi:REP element-mobilizing transposase RayT
LHVPGGCYHVILRGNHRENIFSCADDRLILNSIVADSIEKCDARVHAYCWMTNHLHAMIQIGDQPLGRIVQRVAMKYSRYRHKRLGTTGHLFERRHRAFLVDVDTYFLALLRYIHLNPVEARMVTSPDDYPWSSHRAYLGIETVPWLTVELGLGFLSKTFGGGHTAYQAFIRGEHATRIDSFAVLPSVDSRVIGTDRFLASLPPPRVKLRSYLSLEEMASAVCTAMNVSLDEVRSASRCRYLTEARVTIARRATDERIASLRTVAAFLDRSQSAISQMLKRAAIG